MTVIRVLLVDEYETVRHALRLLCESQTDLTVVGEASTAFVGVQLAETTVPDVVLLNVSLPGTIYLAAARAMRETSPAIGIIAWTHENASSFVSDAMAAGIRGYVLKRSASAELFRAIRAVAAGAVYLDSGLAAESLSTAAPRGGAAARLSNREQEVLRLAAIGHGDQCIATFLGISVKTVETHKWNAKRKLGLASRVDLLYFALARGWVPSRPKPPLAECASADGETATGSLTASAPDLGEQSRSH